MKKSFTKIFLIAAVSLRTSLLGLAITIALLLQVDLNTSIAAPLVPQYITIGEANFRVSRMGPDGNENYHGQYAALTYNNRQGEFLVVWSGDDNQGGYVTGEKEIWAQRVDAYTGELLGSNFRVSSMGTVGNPAFDALSPKVAYSPVDNKYLVVWHGDEAAAGLVDNEYEIWGQFINGSNGSLSGTRFGISVVASGGLTFLGGTHPDLVYNSSDNEFMVVWQGNPGGEGIHNSKKEIFGRRVSGAGTVGGYFRISFSGSNDSPTTGANTPAIAYDSQMQQYLVVWSGRNDQGGLDPWEHEIWGQRLSRNGTRNGENFRISRMGPDGNRDFNAERPALAYNPHQAEYLVIWEGDHENSTLVDDEYEIWGQRIKASDGTLLNSNFRISFMGPDGDTRNGARHPEIDYNLVDREYLVVWVALQNAIGESAAGDEVRGQRLSSKDALLKGNMIRISQMGPEEGDSYIPHYPAVSSHSGYLVVWDSNHDLAGLDGLEREVWGKLFRSSSDLGISTVSVNPNPAIPGGSLNYSIVALNNGPDVAHDIVISSNLSPHYTFVSASGEGWSCTVADSLLQCSRTELLESSITPTLIVNGLLSREATASISHTFIVGSNTLDLNPLNDAKSLSLPLTSPASCSLKVSPACRRKIRRGQKCTFTTTIRADDIKIAARYRLERSLNKKRFKKLKNGTTKSNGRGRRSAKITRKSYYRSNFSLPSCKTNTVRIRTRQR